MQPLFSLYLHFLAVEIRSVFSHAKLMINELKRLEKIEVPELVSYSHFSTGRTQYQGNFTMFSMCAYTSTRLLRQKWIVLSGCACSANAMNHLKGVVSKLAFTKVGTEIFVQWQFPLSKTMIEWQYRFISSFALLQLEASSQMHVEAQLVELNLARIYWIDTIWCTCDRNKCPLLWVVSCDFFVTLVLVVTDTHLFRRLSLDNLINLWKVECLRILEKSPDTFCS